MVPINSEIENKIYSLYVLEELLKPQGFVIASNWDYDNGSFDLKMDDKDAYYFIRIPFDAVAGSLDYPGVTVRVEQPYVLGHQYKKGTDTESVNNGAISGTFNQFQTPEDPDSAIPDEYVEMGKEIMQRVEELLLPSY